MLGADLSPKDITTWYKASFPLLEPWSSDWPNWDTKREYYEGHISTEGMKRVWGVVGEVEPLAFIPDWLFGTECFFVFSANGGYYWYEYTELKRFEGPFADHDHFLRCLDDEEIWRNVFVVYERWNTQYGGPNVFAEYDDWIRLQEPSNDHAHFLRCLRDGDIWADGTVVASVVCDVMGLDGFANQGNFFQRLDDKHTWARLRVGRYTSSQN
ncbi:hypothetical protein DFH06DRAFT_1485041 [Mycena polygramma]|nr:hypothetical protein DFH06DRAFT_1485041 [Mycena polygramma]